MTTWTGWLTAGLLLGGCATADSEPAAEVEAGSPPGADLPAPERPATRQAEIMIEGMPEPLSMRLFQTPTGFPLPFSTYVPQDMVAEPLSSGEGDAVHFVAAFGGRRSDDARLVFSVLAAGTTREQALRAAQQVAEQTQAAPEPEPRFPWAEASYRLAGQRAGFLALGQHAGRWFYLLQQYPPEFGDGFAPRAELIRSEWRWEDSGTGLAG